MAKELAVTTITVFSLLLVVRGRGGRGLFRAAIINAVTVVVMVGLAVRILTEGGGANTDVVEGTLRHRRRTAVQRSMQVSVTLSSTVQRDSLQHLQIIGG
jgi:hypothetical protein